jgi:hypothetical protein
MPEWIRGGVGAAMNDIRIYQIQISGQIAESEIASFCPPGSEIELDGKDCSILTVHTDQSGWIGLIRQLHGRGFELLSIVVVSPDDLEKKS